MKLKYPFPSTATPNHMIYWYGIRDIFETGNSANNLNHAAKMMQAKVSYNR